MKLHLPSGLRKALLACLAALAMPVFTVSSGAALFGGVAFTVMAAQQASADDVALPSLPELLALDDEEDEDELYAAPISLDDAVAPYAFVYPDTWGDPVAYDDLGSGGSNGSKMLPGDSWIYWESQRRDAKFNMQSRINNLRLEVRGASESQDVRIKDGNFNVANLWVTGVGRLGFNSGISSIHNVENIYIDGASIYFIASYTNLKATFYLGVPQYRGDSGHDETVNYSNIRVGANTATTGGMVVDTAGGARGARLVFSDSKNSFSLGGALTGTGNFEVVAFSASYLGTFRALAGGQLDGAFKLSNGANLELGSGTTLHVSSFASNNKGNANSIKVDGGQRATLLVDGVFSITGDAMGKITTLENIDAEVGSINVTSGSLFLGQQNNSGTSSLVSYGNVSFGSSTEFVVRTGSSFTAKGRAQIEGVLYAWTEEITLEKGGYIATLDLQHADLNLTSGADLEIGVINAHYNQGPRNIIFSGASTTRIATIKNNSSSDSNNKLGHLTVDGAGTKVITSGTIDSDVTLSNGGALSLTRGNITGTINLNGALIITELTGHSNDGLLTTDTINVGENGVISINITNLEAGDYKLFRFEDWNSATWDGRVQFNGLGKWEWDKDHGILKLASSGWAAEGDKVLDNGADIMWSGTPAELDKIRVTRSIPNSPDAESVINIEQQPEGGNSTWNVGTIIIEDKDATLVLDGAASRTTEWVGGTLNVTTITNNGTLVIRGAASVHGDDKHDEWHTVFGDGDGTIEEIGEGWSNIDGDGKLALDFYCQFVSNAMARPELRKVTGSAYKGDIVLRRGVFRWTSNEWDYYKSLTVEDGAQFYLCGVSSVKMITYTRDIHIAGSGYVTNWDAPQVQDGALRLGFATLTGDLYLDADARIAVYRNNDRVGYSNLDGNVYGGGHRLYKRDGGILTFAGNNGSRIENLLGLYTEQSIGDENATQNRGGKIVIRDGKALVLGSEFEFGVNVGTTIEVQSNAIIKSAEDGEGNPIAGTITKTGAGTLDLMMTLANVQEYTGSLVIKGGTVNVGTDTSSSPDAIVYTSVSMAGGTTLNLGSATFGIGGLNDVEEGSGARTVTTERSSASLVINTARETEATTSAVFNRNGHIIALTKTGEGKQTFTSAVEVTAVGIENGTLALTGGGSVETNIFFKGTNSILELTGTLTAADIRVNGASDDIKLQAADEQQPATLVLGNSSQGNASVISQTHRMLTIGEGVTLRTAYGKGTTNNPWRTFKGDITIYGTLELQQGQFDYQSGTMSVRNGGMQSVADDNGAYQGSFVMSGDGGAKVYFNADPNGNLNTNWSRLNRLDFRIGNVYVSGNLEVFGDGIYNTVDNKYGSGCLVTVESGGHLLLSNSKVQEDSRNVRHSSVTVKQEGKLTRSKHEGDSAAGKQLLIDMTVQGTAEVTEGTLDVTTLNVESWAEGNGGGSVTVTGTGTFTIGTASIEAGGSLTYDGGTLSVGSWDVTEGENAASSGALKIVRGRTLQVSSFYKCTENTLRAIDPLNGTSSSDLATVEWVWGGEAGFDQIKDGSVFGAEINLKFNISPNDSTFEGRWFEVRDLTVKEQLELGTGELCLHGTSALAKVTAGQSGTGRLTIMGNASVTIGGKEEGSTINNYLDMQHDGATLHLIDDLSIKGLSSSQVDDGSTVKIDSIGSDGKRVDRVVNLTINTNDNYTYKGSIDISGELKKKGTGTQVIERDVQADGGIAVEGKGKLELHGNVLGGDIIVDGSELSVSGSAVAANDAVGRLSLRGAGGKLTLGRDMTIGGLSSLESTSVSGTQTIEGSGTLTLKVVGEQKSEEDGMATIRVAKGVTLVKTGEGSQSLGDISSEGTVRVAEGTLKLTGTNIAGRIADMQVEEGGTLEIARKGWSSAGKAAGELEGGAAAEDYGSALTLAGGALRVTAAPAVASEHVKIALREMTLGAGESTFAWTADGSAAQGRITGQLSVTFDKLTSAKDANGDVVKGGKLEVANFGSEQDDSNHRRRLVFNTVEDFAGELVAKEVTGPYSRIAIGHVNQSAGVSGKMDVGGGVYSNDFRKEGKGELELNELSVIVFSESGEQSGRLYMDYEGSLKVGSVHVADGAALYYTEGHTEDYVGEKQLGVGVEELEGMQEGIYLNIDEVLSSHNGTVKLQRGICLGITGVEDYTEEDLSVLKRKMTLANASYDTEWSLHVRDGKLWLIVDSFISGETSWDENWGEHGLYNAPGDDLMEAATLTAADLAKLVEGDGADGSFAEYTLALEGHKVDEVHVYKGGPLQNVITLADGSASERTLATVVGGRLYSEANGEEATLGEVQGSSYILLKPAEGKADEEVHYHLLVGGSSCTRMSLSGNDNEAGGGYTGSTHIQVEGGTVDYIVGGNHATNLAFSFNGASYISVMGGEVLGGIVGGSTLTVGSTAEQEDVVEYAGVGSNIFIYTALHNTAATPELSTGEGVADNAFTAVVGGNAWVGLPTSGEGVDGMAPAFRANSMICIDLSPKVEEAAEGKAAGEKLVFEKDIVGGNYTVFTSQGSDSEYGNRSTEFEGNAVVTISIGERADEDVTFTGSIVGASRRASGGAGSTVFKGNTEVTLNGGTYEKAVVGGMRFDSTADGKHTALLEGHTKVTVNGGRLWRVVGGSYSLAGSGGTGVEGNPESIGNASVVINGGRFAAEYGSTTQEGQKGQALVAGGDFYRSTGGTDHLRKGNTSVTITGGQFAGLHIAGGDYANFTGVDAGDGTGISGTSSVAIGGRAVSITGLVIGGSYLTDEGQGGNVSTKQTKVTIGSGTRLEAEAPTAEHMHQGIAVVAGHVIIDEGSGAEQTGGHRATVTGGTEVVMEGGTVSGHMVGGSYVNETDGVNELISQGEHLISLNGGELSGNVYGGHYSENTAQPDKLTLGDVKITLSGAAVYGDIVGGNYRAATQAASGNDVPTQGNIEITLESGELQGSVYAAGRHAGKGAALQVKTTSTLVKVGSGVALGQGSTISGGYDKVSAKDGSSVESAVLDFYTAGKDYANLDEVSSWKEFDTVSAAANATLTGRFTAAEKTTFTKLGSGKLTLTQGLLGADGKDYTGRVQVDGGILALGAEHKLSSLGFNMDSRKGSNSMETAYLQAVGAGVLAMPADEPVEVEFSGKNALRPGTYYLTGVLAGEGVASKKAEDLFHWEQDVLDALAKSYKEAMKATLLMKDGCLVLRAYMNDSDHWYWQGGNGDKWTNDSATDWSRENGSKLADDSKLNDDVADVHFNAGAETFDVTISGVVTPRNIYVESGKFTFSAENAQTVGISTVNNGTLYVGTEEEENTAELRLELSNASIPNVVLEKSGTLTLAAAGALGGLENLDFNGGKLVYAEVEGQLAYTEDVSAKVVAADEAAGTGGGIIRLQVGESAALRAGEAPEVTWGAGETRAANQGLQRALRDGIEKSGRGNLTLNWKEESSAELRGVVEVQEGGLTLALSTGAEDTRVTLAGEEMSVAGGAKLQLTASGNGRMEVKRALSGEGRAEIGGAGGNYTVDADNSAFAGTIALVGDSEATTLIRVEKASALGGKSTTLELAGRQIHLVGEAGSAAKSTLNAGTVHVAEGSVNYLGDVNYVATNVNAAITLTGKVEGSGVLANALGGYSHTITGDMSGFEGTLVAGMAEVGKGDFTSTWTLKGSSPKSVQTSLAGIGEIRFAYEGAGQTLLTGQVGDAALGQETSLRNTGAGTTIVLAGGAGNSSTGALIFDGGDFQIGKDKSATGSWAGTIAGQQGTLKLVSGSIAKIGDRGEVNVVADVAQGAMMEMNGTDGGTFSGITVNEEGRLNGVSGTIMASSLGVAGTSVVTLKMGEKNVGNGPGAPEDYMIGMEAGGKMHVGNAEGLVIDFGNSSFVTVLKKFRADETHDNRAYLHVLDGGELSFAEGLEDDLSFLFGKGGTPQMLKDLGFRLDRTPENPGDLELTGTSENVYLVIGPDGAEDAKSDERHVTDWKQFEGYYATVVDEGATLHIDMSEHNMVEDEATGELTANDRIVVENLVGLEGSTLKGSNRIGDGSEITIVLDNTRIEDMLDGTGLGSVDKTVDEVRGQDTEFYGTIVGEERVNFEKTGKGTLTVGNGDTGNGGLLIEGELALKEGSVAVAGNRGGEGNELGALVFDYAEEGESDEARGMTLQGGKLTVHGIEERGAYKGDDVVNLEEGASMVYAAADEATLESTRFAGEGELVVDGATLTLDSANAENKERLSGVRASVVNGGSLNLTEGTQVKDGALHAADGGSLVVKGSAISGETEVHLEKDGSLALDGSTLKTTGSMTLEAESAMTLSNGAELTAGGGLTVDGMLDLADTTRHEITGLAGSGTLRGALPADGGEAKAPEIILHGKDNSFSGVLDGAGKMSIGADDALTLNRVSRGKNPGAWDVTNGGELTIDLTDGAKSVLGDLHLSSNSSTTMHINTDEGADRMGRLDLSNFTWESGAELEVHNSGSKTVPGSTIDMGLLSGELSTTELKVRLTGATLSHYERGSLRKDTATNHWVLDMVLSRTNLFRTDNMEKNAAAGADMLWAASDPNSANWKRLTDGDTTDSDLYHLVDVVSSYDKKTQAGEMSRTLAAAAGASTSVLGAAFAQDVERQLHAVRNRTTSMQPGERPRGFNLWLNGEGAYHKLGADGLAPGYTLTSWGGTLGMDMSVSSRTTVGLALSALYGNLKTESADNGRGDMDTTYATFFARTTQGAWMHTLLFSAGMADVTLERTVSFGNYGYKTKGSTDGYAAGLLYELGYTTIMNAEGSFLLQSVFNVEFRHATINGYNETNSDAALTVDDASYNTVTVGAGARVQAAVGGRVLNRTALLEARALVKADAGDRSGKVENDFVNGNHAKRELESAEIGAVGIELGAGVTIPVGKRGSIFMDGSVELRSGYSSMDANVGYKLSF